MKRRLVIMRKSTLYSFGFAKYDYIPPVVLDLFSAYENTTVNGEPVLNYTLEVYEAVMDGRINVKHFNMIGFIKAIQENTKINVEKSAKKVTYFRPEGSDDEADGVVENHVKVKEDKYAEYDDADEVQWAVNQVNSLHDEFFINYGVHLIHVMKKAAIGFPQAVEIIRNLCEEVDTLSELVYIILSSGKSLDELFPEEEERPKKSEIAESVEKVIAERENTNDKVIAIQRAYDRKDANILQMKKMGLEAYKIGTGAYVAFSADVKEQKSNLDIANC